MKNLFKVYVMAIAMMTLSCNNDDNGPATMEPNEINIENLTVSIDENPTNGDVVGMVQTNGSGNLSFSITDQTPAGALAIDQSTGELTVADASLFDYEVNTVITATVFVVNAADPATVTVNINNITELTVQDLTVDFDENPTNGEVIGSVQMNGASTYSIDSQTPAGAIALDASTGELTVADATLFDFETNPVITATVSVTDGTAPATVTINLNDVAELTLQDLTVSIDENPTDGQVLGAIQTTSNGTPSFSITSQTPSGAMGIDAGTGELTVIDPNLFDYEANPMVSATISVNDGAETATAVATINLNDVDEVSATNTNLTIDENPSNGAIVGSLQASGSNLTYTITFQNPAGAFTIDQSTGELSVADETLFDFETNPNMLATISVDNGIQSVSANALVALNDVNEIGEFKYGGVIFWIDPTSNNSAGLVCAITDQGTNIAWGCQGTILGGTATTIGSGEANTTAILAGCATPGIAADIAANATIGGFSDWFLPSIDELQEVYTNRAVINATATANGGTVFSTTPLTSFYFSSTEVAATAANIIDFSNGTQQNGSKNPAVFSIRAVRTWTDF